ncbi:sulfur carrier protein ThiS [Corynebacterium uberis]|uniref:sulfur carrier protein ThiS n=1 Tax=Corynebacterium TaxID=1716 RepID=UPI001D09B79E|nr:MULTISPECIES: sulfur carrier protein ThiS [Corynebacterium]MCZ9308401.1 sulfur carrier protein ThiS [Corynebacterium sp. c6VSa_13]UDL74072.1 sulfur carrier protein ThiS [Corynebacterium uberis]UDL75045.1 sulfur carrier protein ThiS [Corynebacterium uberis]UDL77258.1 sulfur carrier protein ThiS [Corynebacterium uberis]UDL79542.1 sulfur carrier protein ThiS [Corynebacterium uberis]
MIAYTVNDQPRHDAGGTIADLPELASPSGVAVAVNGAVVPRSEWSRPISDGDVIDILTAVQGG